MRNVLIFAYECAPYNSPRSTVAAQRPAQLAKYLSAHGWRPIVICSNFNLRGGASRPDLDALVNGSTSARGARQGIVIPTPSLPSDGHLDLAWQAAVAAAERHRWVFPLRKALTALKLLTGDYSQPWQPVAREVAIRVAERHKIDACIGEHSPDAGIFLARWFSRRFRVPWVADFRDPMLLPFSSVKRRLYAPIARRLVASATCTVAVTPVWATADAALFGLPAHSIPNGFDPDEFPRADERVELRGLRVAYLGNVWREQEPEVFLKGLAVAAPMLRHGAVPFRFLYRGRAHASIAQQAAELRIDDLVDAGPAVSRSEALAAMRSADALLLLSLSQRRTTDPLLQRGFYPAKTFEYFGARRPILCVPGDGALLDELIRTSQTGVVASSPREVASWLCAAMERRAAGEPLPYQPDDRVVSSFERGRLAGKLAELLDDVVRDGAGRSPSPKDAFTCAAS